MVASAHRPLTTAPGCGDDFGVSSRAALVPDASISWAFQHYLDCSRTAVWMAFKNPKPGFAFYVSEEGGGRLLPSVRAPAPTTGLD